MANVLGTLFTDIANAIRNKTGTTAKMSPKDFPIQINNIVVGGGGSTTEGWVTLIEEQSVTPVYDNNHGCYAATVPIVDVREQNIDIGTIFIVHLDGISYPVGMGAVPGKATIGSNTMTMVFYAAGNYEIRKNLYGAAVEYTTQYCGNEPFLIMGNSGKQSQTILMFPDNTPHTIKVEYMPRYGTT